MNLDVPEAIPGEFFDDVVVGAIGPTDEDDSQRESTHHAQAGEDGPVPLTENVPESHLEREHVYCLSLRFLKVNISSSGETSNLASK